MKHPGSPREDNTPVIECPSQKNLTLPIIFLTTLLLVCSSDAKADTSGDRPKSIAELEAAVEKVLKETKTPGVGIAIVSRDQAEWVTGIGKADVAANLRVTADTLFRLGSISKSFAALAALKLQEEGKLKLTDTVKQWAPDVAFSNPWEATDPVRLVHLMEHTSGFNDILMREYAHNDPTPVTLKEALAYGEASRVCRWRPGSRMSYCNSGPGVLAAVVEKVSGQRFEDYVQEHFFRPLHMDTASYFLTPEVQRRLTGLYHADGVTTYPYWHITFRSSGAINASAKDMANYVRFYLQQGSLDGTQLLHSSSVERMERTETLPSARLGNIAGYGLYNRAMPEGAFTFRGHGGAIMGALSEMAYLPDAGRGYAVMINSGNGHALWRITKLIRTYLVRDLTPPLLPPPVSVPAELQRHYGGYYQIISPREQWLYAFDRLARIKKLTFTSESLSASTYGFSREKWMPVSPRLYRKENQTAATLALLPDEDGKVLMECDWITFKKVSALRIWSQAAGIGLAGSLVLSSVLFAPIWIVRMIFGKLHNPGPLSVRVTPLLGAAFLIVFDVALAIGLRGTITCNEVDDLTALGTPSVLALTIMLSSIAFVLATAASLYVLYRERTAPMNRVVYWHSLAVTAGLLGVAIYYGYWGLIGVRLWA
jgi:CubicO group peptidase (beta-lactamase class C family)